MKVAIIGDSISEGIGRKKINYCNLLEEEFPEHNFLNFSLTGTTIKYAISRKDELIAYKPDILIMCYGQVEALTRPKKNTLLYKVLPNRYKGLGMLDPRALYTRKLFKRSIQKLDSVVRYNIKKMLIQFYGYEQWVDLEEFKNLYNAFIDDIKPHVPEIIVLSTVSITDFYFPKCSDQFVMYNNAIKEVSNKKKLIFIDIYQELKKHKPQDVFLQDNFHPNLEGYEIIANNIVKQSKSISG